MEPLEKEVKNMSFMEERFREKLRTLREIENPPLGIPYHREKALVNKSELRRESYINR